jgi:putative FmdB family regulatory protein
VPIYEFYCTDCHALFNFFARTMNTTKQPACPRCGRPDLERWMSRVAISKGRAEPGPAGDMPEGDDAQMERAMEELARDADGIDEEDPRQMARMMRRLAESSGMALGERMEEAVRRLEAGQSPEEVEEELGDLLEEDEPFAEKPAAAGGRGRKSRPPEVDETLYDL